MDFDVLLRNAFMLIEIPIPPSIGSYHCPEKKKEKKEKEEEEQQRRTKCGA
jgi:hypothetical protein